MSDDYDVDDLLDQSTSKKTVNQKKKGSRVELRLSKILSAHFEKPFSRSVGSGNRFSQVSQLPEHALQTFMGDLCVPKGFRFVIECKGGYNDVNLSQLITKGSKALDGFLSQVTSDSKQCGREPIVFWKMDRRDWLAIYHHSSFAKTPDFKVFVNYGDWRIVNMKQLLERTDQSEWFFENCC